MNIITLQVPSYMQQERKYLTPVEWIQRIKELDMMHVIYDLKMSMDAFAQMRNLNRQTPIEQTIYNFTNTEETLLHYLALWERDENNFKQTIQQYRQLTKDKSNLQNYNT
jgi:hypothetical protein